MEDKLLTLYDNKNTIVFPLKAEEVMQLLSCKADFEKYINCNFDACDLALEENFERLLKIVQKYNDLNEKTEFCDLYVITSVKDRTIVGLFVTDSIKKDVDVEIIFNDKYVQSGCLYSAIELLCKHLKQNEYKNIKILCKNTKHFNLALKNNNFEIMNCEDCNQNLLCSLLLD